MKKLTLILLLVALLAFSSKVKAHKKGYHRPCDNNSGSEKAENSGDNSFHACDPDNRQQACTYEYIPVCGYIHNCEGGACTQTFGNKCAACAGENVDGYLEGACEDIRTDCDPDNRQQACPFNYLPTCAVAANCQGSHCFEDTSNSCVACSLDYVAYSLPGACPSSDKDERTYCEDPRPEVCTADYTPVCAHRANCVGNYCFNTAGNVCSACGDANVDWHVPGECSSDEITYCDTTNRPEICTADYNPVCAHRMDCEGADCYSTAGNACSACAEEDVDYHRPGECL